MLSKSAYASQDFNGSESGEKGLSGTYFKLYEITPDLNGMTIKDSVPVLNHQAIMKTDMIIS